MLALKDPLAALQFLAPLLRDHPDHPDVMLTAARAYFKSAQLNKALELSEKMVEANPADFYARPVSPDDLSSHGPNLALLPALGTLAAP